MNFLQRMAFVCLLPVCAAAMPDLAAADTGLTLQLGSATQYDDNLFRLDGRPLAGRFVADDLSDKVSAGVLGAFSFYDFNTSVDASANRDFYRNNDYLDNTGFDINAAAHRSGDIFSDDLTITSSRQLSSFEYIEGTVKNVQTITMVTNEARYTIANYVRLVLDGNFLKTDNSSSAYSINNVHEEGRGVGIGYYSPTLNYINVVETFNDEQGDNSSPIILGVTPTIFRTDFTESLTSVNVHYAPSVISSLDGNIGYTKRFDHSVLKDSVSGVTGNISLTYAPDDLFQGVLRLRRQFSAETFLFTDSVVFEGVDLSLTKVLTPQIKLIARSYYNKILYNFFLQAGSGLSDRNDNVYGGALTIDYNFRDYAIFELMGRHEVRDSNVPGLNYSDNTVGFTIKLKFGSHDTATLAAPATN